MIIYYYHNFLVHLPTFIKYSFNVEKFYNSLANKNAYKLCQTGKLHLEREYNRYKTI